MQMSRHWDTVFKVIAGHVCFSFLMQHHCCGETQPHLSVYTAHMIIKLSCILCVASSGCTYCIFDESNNITSSCRLQLREDIKMTSRQTTCGCGLGLSDVGARWAFGSENMKVLGAHASAFMCAWWPHLMWKKEERKCLKLNPHMHMRFGPRRL